MSKEKYINYFYYNLSTNYIIKIKNTQKKERKKWLQKILIVL